ncbi:MAG TPA: hypothetical protein ACFYEK_06100 [Candidatus Wunengus sp. YC60]|uniref:hypothetical protein n=1 Tax=Candidatus Wunengus sp. YC60 TaxID=3367697 RepID=UPI0040255E0E
MATITATKAGNWSDTTVWDLARVPQADDDVALAGYVIVWDTALTRIPATGTLTSITSTGTAGQISLALDDAAFHSGAGLYATTIQCGTAPATYGIIYVTGTTDHVLTIVTGSSPNGIVGGSNVNAFGIYNPGTGTINITGDLTGGSGANTPAIHTAGSSTVVGNLFCGTGVSGSSYGFYNNGTGTISITGNITAGNYLDDCGFYNNSTGVVSVNGIITGGGSITAYGFYNKSTGQVTLSATSQLVQGTNAPAYDGLAPAWQPDSTAYAKFYTGASFGQAANTEFPQVLAAEDIKAGVTSGSVTGTFMIMLKTFVKILTESGWVSGV